MDGSAVDSPIQVASLAAGTSESLPAIPYTFTQAGNHSIRVVVDAAKANPDYMPTNNTVTITRYVAM